MKHILVLLLAACGSSSPKKPDAAAASDAPGDAPVDAPVDAYVPHYHYVLSKEQWPVSSTEARAFGFDLDGDPNMTIDNQFGAMVAALKTQYGLDLLTPADEAIAHGTTITLADLATDDLSTSQSSWFTLYQGTNPNPPPCNGSADTVCGDHLDGTASFTAATVPRDTPIAGVIGGSQLSAGPGHLTVGLTVFGSTTITLLAAHAALTVAPNGIMAGTIGGAMTMADIDAKVFPAMQRGITSIIARDCHALSMPPACGCVSATQGATLLTHLDSNHDCTVTLDEVTQDSVIKALVHPDVTVESQQAISVGFAVQAVDAAFTP